jgi:hypothetical protein
LVRPGEFPLEGYELVVNHALQRRIPLIANDYPKDRERTTIDILSKWAKKKRRWLPTLITPWRFYSKTADPPHRIFQIHPR